MPRQFTEIPVDGGLNFLQGTMDRSHNELKNVYTKDGHLRRRLGLTIVGPTSTPGTAGNVRLITEHIHGDEPGTETERPNGDGYLQQWTPLAGDNYAAVDEVTADDDTTYVKLVGPLANKFDYYDFTDMSGLTTIDKLTFYIRCKLVDLGAGADFENVTVMYYDVSLTTAHVVGTTSNWRFANGWLTKTIESTVNPRDASAWVVADFNADQFGIVGSPGANEELRCTQFYVLAEGSGAATRERSKIVISNTEFLRLEEDLASFTDIDDGLASAAGATQVWDTCEFDNLIWFTNDIDDFFSYPDAGNLIDQNSTNLEARTIAAYGDRLFAGNIEEGASRYRSRVRWSVVGDGDDFAGAGSGNFDLDGRPGQIIKFMPMAEKATTYTGILAVYKDTSIFHVYATGTADDPFDYRLMDGSVGCVGTQALDIYSNEHTNTEVHAFVGKRNGELNVFEWNGNNIFAIGNAIAKDINANYNPSSIENTIVKFDPNTSLLWCGVPRDQETFPSAFYTYNIITQQWKEHFFDDSVCTLGQLLLASDATLCGGKTDGLILKSDTSTTVDTGADSETLVETGDIPLAGVPYQATLYRLWIWYIERTAATLVVDVSNDGGDSYGTSDSVSLLGTDAGKLNLAYADIIQSGRTFRFRFVNSTDEDIEIVKVMAEWEPKPENP